MSGEIALFCLLHPASLVKRARVLALLDNIQPYYLKPASKCTTWCYFTPSSRTNAPSQIVNAEGSDAKSTMLAGIEIYTTKDALQAQIDDEIFFQPYQKAVASENLYSKPEQLVAWYPSRGFMARDGTSASCGSGVVVVIAKVTVKNDFRADFLAKWGDFADWCRSNESNTLSYKLFTRVKATDEVLIVERYTSSEAFESHRNSRAFKETSKLIKPLVKDYILNEWDEIEGSFVSGNPKETHDFRSTSKI